MEIADVVAGTVCQLSSVYRDDDMEVLVRTLEHSAEQLMHSAGVPL